MDFNDEQLLIFLQQQLEWHQRQDAIYEQIEVRLKELKSLATYKANNEISFLEQLALNDQVEKLKLEIEELEQSLDSSIIN